MLEVIHQNGLQKINTKVYYVEPTYSEPNPDNEEDKPELLFATIYALVDSYGMVPLAQYDSLDDASAIFAHLVFIERNGGLAVLPKDDPKEIEEFLVTKDFTYQFSANFAK